MPADQEGMAAHPHRPPVRSLENGRVVGVEPVYPLRREPSGKRVWSGPRGHLVAATIMARWLLEVKQERGGVVRATSVNGSRSHLTRLTAETQRLRRV